MLKKQVRKLAVVMDSNLHFCMTWRIYVQAQLRKLPSTGLFSIGWTSVMVCSQVSPEKATRQLGLFTQTKKAKHNAPVLRSLHSAQATCISKDCFKNTSFVVRLRFKIFISDLLLCYKPSRHFRLSGSGLLTVARNHKKHWEADF